MVNKAKTKGKERSSENYNVKWIVVGHYSAVLGVRQGPARRVCVKRAPSESRRRKNGMSGVGKATRCLLMMMLRSLRKIGMWDAVREEE